MTVLDRMWYGNTVQAWVIALVLAVAVMAALYVLRQIAVRRLSAIARRTATDLDELIVDLARRTRSGFMLAVAVYLAALTLTLPRAADRVLGIVAAIAALFQLALWGNSGIGFGVNRYVQRRMEQDPASATTVAALSFVGKALLWAIILLVALDNIGVDITALLTGLGVGGIAVALALQNVLGDLFAAFSIALDKPFRIGDFIIVGDLLGTVEHIGLKTTRLRSLSGEQIVFSNADLLTSRIRNFKQMYERRVTFTLGVAYETPLEKLQAIPRMVRQIVEAQPQTRFDRAHFKAYGDFSLNFEVVYYVLTPDYTTYMEIQQAINLELYRQFQHEGIEFAYPTQTVHVRGALQAATPQMGSHT